MRKTLIAVAVTALGASFATQAMARDYISIVGCYDGIAIANSKDAPRLDLTAKDLFLALAKDVPNPDGTETLVANPYKTWKEVNPSLPDTKIEVLGPLATSGTRDVSPSWPRRRAARLYRENAPQALLVPLPPYGGGPGWGKPFMTPVFSCFGATRVS